MQAHQDSREIHPSMQPKVGGLDFGGGCRARGVVVKAVGIAKVVVAEEAVG